MRLYINVHVAPGSTGCIYSGGKEPTMLVCNWGRCDVTLSRPVLIQLVEERWTIKGMCRSGLFISQVQCQKEFVGQRLGP